MIAGSLPRCRTGRRRAQRAARTYEGVRQAGKGQASEKRAFGVYEAASSHVEAPEDTPVGSRRLERRPRHRRHVLARLRRSAAAAACRRGLHAPRSHAVYGSVYGVHERERRRQPLDHAHDIAARGHDHGAHGAVFSQNDTARVAEHATGTATSAAVAARTVRGVATRCCRACSGRSGALACARAVHGSWRRAGLRRRRRGRGSFHARGEGSDERAAGVAHGAREHDDPEEAPCLRAQHEAIARDVANNGTYRSTFLLAAMCNLA
jgi:hypothetical protein